MLNINDIFCSFDGEVNAFGQGRRTVFVRLQGCNLDPPCKWCDTPEAIPITGKPISPVLEIIDDFDCDKVTITGGEPLLQTENLLDLICDLKRKDYFISVETNGTFNVDKLMFNLVDSWVVDFKPFYTYSDFKFPYHYMRMSDWIKFVITCEEDFIYSLSGVNGLGILNHKTNFSWAPIYPGMTHTQLANLMMQYKVHGNINVQLHKLLNIK